jgi:ubiquinone biosynthesis protein UbiJ
VADFLSDPWFEELNARLRTSSPLPADARPCRIRVEFDAVPAGLPTALTLVVGEGAHVTPGDDVAADTTIRLAYDDALAIASGVTDSASALRDGRVKVRGDINVVVPLAGWLHAALFD